MYRFLLVLLLLPATVYAADVNGFNVTTVPSGSGVAITVVPSTPQPPQPPAPPTPPNPPGPPLPYRSLSAVGVWSALGAPPKLASAAHSLEVAQFLKSQNGSWLVLDPLMLTQPGPQPAWLAKWFDLQKKSGKQPPCVIWHDNGNLIRVDQLTNDSDPTSVLVLAKSCLGVSTNSVTIRGKTYSLGLAKRVKAPGKAGFPQLSAVLKPLTPAEYPTCDYRYLLPYVKDQGSTGTCASQAGVTMLEGLRRGQFGPANDVELSPWCLSTQISGWNGATLGDVMQALSQGGTCTMAQWGQTKKGPAGWQAMAKERTLLAVYDSPNSDPLGYLAAALARGWLVEIGINVGSGYDTNSQGRITYARGSGRGGHAQLVWGMMKDSGVVWLGVRNSWGKNWGMNGDAWIESTFLTKSGFNDLWAGVVASAASTDKSVAPAVSNQKQKPEKVRRTANLLATGA